MQVDLRDERRRRLGRVEVDPAARPSRVRVTPPRSEPRDVFLLWEQALDDSGALRRCVACGGELFRQRTLPQVTPFVVVLAAAGVVIVALGYAGNPWVFGALVGVLLLDVLVLLLARQRLVCYRCGSSFSGIAVARYHRRWDPLHAEASPPVPPPATPSVPPPATPPATPPSPPSPPPPAA